MALLRSEVTRIGLRMDQQSSGQYDCPRTCNRANMKNIHLITLWCIVKRILRMFHFLIINLLYCVNTKYVLTLSSLYKKNQHTTFCDIFLFFPETGFDISCKICMKCQNLFSGKIRKTIINLSSAVLFWVVLFVCLFVFMIFSRHAWLGSRSPMLATGQRGLDDQHM